MFRIAQNYDDMLKAYAVRAIVFVEEQATGYAIEVDEREHESIHILGEIDGEPVAAGRIRFVDGYAKLERLAIRKAWRKLGHGSRLIEYMMGVATERGVGRFKLHAQLRSLEFYEKHQFKPVGDIFLEADIEHRVMIR